MRVTFGQETKQIHNNKFKYDPVHFITSKQDLKTTQKD